MTLVEEEIRRRIHVTVWAYAYELCGDSLVSDAKFDEECYKVRPNLETGNKRLDKFFKEEFAPYTGSWIKKHPELNKVKALYERIYKK